MKYHLGYIHEPFEEDEEQDMWAGSIDCTVDRGNFPDDIDHEECITIYAETEKLLKHRANTIIDTLNETPFLRDTQSKPEDEGDNTLSWPLLKQKFTD